MKRESLSLAAAALIAFACLGAEVKVPAEVKVKVGRLIKIEATSATPVKWINTSEDLDCIPDSSGKSAIATSQVAGRYKVAVYTADKDGPSDPAYCVVVVGDPAPVPPGPGPTPNPTDPLQASLQAAATGEASADKTTNLGKLTALYRQMAVKLNDPISVTTLNTPGKLMSVFKSAQATLGITPTTLPKVRRVAADYINSQTGTDANAVLDRAKAAAAFTKVADLLANVKRSK